MDVFKLRDQLVQDFASYTSSFLRIRDRQIAGFVEDSIVKGLLWPDPRIQLNPAFEPGAAIDDLVAEGVLHEECRGIFRRGKSTEGRGEPLRLHRHQEEAVRAAKIGGNYVLTTGTGSGKSLAYIVPIVDHVLRHGSGSGIQAIVVYPMNALANSQVGELEKFLCEGYPEGRPPVTFRSYTGQEDLEQRDDIARHPPDILLTNYVMLELVLTRPHERRLVDAARELRFLVLDELHTYRGRQGSDVALLVRRVREACEATRLQCVGTSATLASGGSTGEQRAEVAGVASTLFGDRVRPEHVIGETLRRATEPFDEGDRSFRDALISCVEAHDDEPPKTYGEFVADPLSRWLESTFGVTEEQGTGRLVRQVPRPIWDAQREDGAAFDLHRITGAGLGRCRDAIRRGLLAGAAIEDPGGPWHALAFRLHQFIGKGDTVYATVEDPGQRHLTVTGQRYVSGEAGRRLLLPLVFCRQCGQEYYCVRVTRKEGEPCRVGPRDLGDRLDDEDSIPGFLYYSETGGWPDDLDQLSERVPEDWLEHHRGEQRIRPHRRRQLPKTLWLGPDGIESAEGVRTYLVGAPFRFCLHCGVAYTSRSRSDFGKLATLGSEGRSTATTILSLSVIRNLRDDPDPDLAAEARKLLSFTDNRQDASLQAGHFNDFVLVGRLRAALYRALRDAGDGGLTHEVLPQRVLEALALPFEDYASDPGVRFGARNQTEKTLRDVVAYRVYRDLERGWRITSPNLEQTGLLRIAYDSLDALAAAEDVWVGCHPAVAAATSQVRETVLGVLLDELRRRLAVRVDYLDRDVQEALKAQSSHRLRGQWALDEHEQTTHAAVAYPRSRTPDDYDGNLFVSARSAFGQYLRRMRTFPHRQGDVPNLDETEEIVRQLFSGLQEAGLVAVVDERDGVPGFQVEAAQMVWRAGDGTTPPPDPLRVTAAAGGARVNAFFLEFYRSMAAELTNLEAHEHTAQVPGDVRRDREDAFRSGSLPILYCSPTMELGVDIAELAVVNMRNVPPTPANYAQRSGRAGRGGQPALVFTYCTAGSPHDQYFFRRTERMVAGAVAPPRLDLANEDLVRAHVQAIWLAETGADLGSSLGDVLDLEGEDPSMDLLPAILEDVRDPGARARGRARAASVLATLADSLSDAPWFDDTWLDRTIDTAQAELDHACERWRGLYRAAIAQRNQSHRIAGDASVSSRDRQQARRLWYEAGTQMQLLTASDARSLVQSDFYSYRYFASEGFLPGYSFPRLPLSAYIPGTGRREAQDYVSRPRFLAISEFGPRAVIYHEGSVYQIHRVVMPVAEREDGQPLATSSAKLCGRCGYLHPLTGRERPDVCERCGAELRRVMRELFRLQNVITRRRDRITSDEEERLRLGYELRTAVRFAEHGGRPGRETAEVRATGRTLATLTYGHAATVWRLNLGWSRREDKERLGFVLDYDKGIWARHEQVPEDDLPDDPGRGRSRRVVPFVEDRRNCLLVEPVLTGGADEQRAAAAGLQAALKNGIQVAFQLEELELAAEPLPDRDDRRLLLFYEATEGGAGVLRRLLREPGAWRAAVREALDVCHFDPDTGEDRGRAPQAEEACEAACYDCLLSYGNQVDHGLLDRHLVRDVLLSLRDADVSVSPSASSRGTHAVMLKGQAGSELERRFVDWLDQRGSRLPSHAQYRIGAAGTVADFYYADSGAAVYVDGPKHDHAARARADAGVTERLLDLGYEVVRFPHDADWSEIAGSYGSIFGEGP